MNPITFPFGAVIQATGDGLLLAEALGFPEISRLAVDPNRLRRALQRNVRRIVEAAPTAGLLRRHVGGQPTVAGVDLTLEPPTGSILWREPLQLHFPVLRWSHGTDAEIAFVPALGIEVLAAKAEELDERLPREIRAALSRLGQAASLRGLAELQRVRRVRVERLTVSVQIRSPRQRFHDEERERSKTPSVLKQTATDLTDEPGEATYGLESLVERLAELLTARVPRSVLLVGPSGVGKTAAVRELVRCRSAFNLGATPFWATSGARLVAGMYGYGMWQERCRQVVREASRKKAILHLGNLVELMEVGKSEGHSTGVAAFLRPHLARGDLLAVAECTPEQLPLIEREEPQLLDAFQRLTVAEPGEAEGRAILAFAAANEPPLTPNPSPPRGEGRKQDTPLPSGEMGRGEGRMDADALDALDRLHRRYAAYSAQPGRALRFLHNLLRDRKAERVTAGDVLAAFTRETGLPRFLLDPAEPLDLGGVRRWFAERVLDQDEAVDLVVDVIAAVKAGLNRPRKPIASLLFIGPTGVGKTETAKALAEFLFGSRDRLTRFDMSEFGDPIGVQRLVGGVFGAEGLLTGKVREQPFSVVLLDEFEKAHPQFLDLLLQMLGEGRLTDAGGRLADFCNAVVILTSNLGAESFQQGAFGFAGVASCADRDAARAHFEREVRRYLRPELFNRIDRIVPFAPLTADAVRRIAERHLKRLEGRDGIKHRAATLTVGAGAAALLARHGFDARYGARPLVRAVERELLAPTAEQMNRYGGETPLAVTVSCEAGRGQGGRGEATSPLLRVVVKARTDSAGRALTAGAAAPLVEAVRECVEMRRRLQALERASCVRALNNDLFQLERDQKRFEKEQMMYAHRTARLAHAPEEARARLLGKPPQMRPGDQARQSRLAELRGVAEKLRDLSARCCGLEDDAVRALHAGEAAEAFSPADLRPAVGALEKAWFDLLLVFHCQEFPAPNERTLALFGEEADWLLDLAAAYVEAARRWPNAAIAAAAYVLPPGAKKAAKEAAPSPAAGETEAEPGRLFWREDSLISPPAGRRPERELLRRVRCAEAGSMLAARPARLVGMGACTCGRRRRRRGWRRSRASTSSSVRSCRSRRASWSKRARPGWRLICRRPGSRGAAPWPTSTAAGCTTAARRSSRTPGWGRARRGRTVRWRT